jgi:hypothetical protein
MALADVWTVFEKDLDSQSAHILGFAAAKTISASSDFSFLDECLLEGLLSRVWQTWNHFCRSCVIESCVGTTDVGGATIAGLPNATSEAHVSGAAITARRTQAGPCWGTPNTVLRDEPTWGDIDVLVKVLTRLCPSNSAKMLAGFSSSYPSAKALQLVRNAAAHNHAQNMNEVLTLRSSYIVFPIGHPIHALFWTEPGSRDFLVMHAISELRTAGLIAIS